MQLSHNAACLVSPQNPVNTLIDFNAIQNTLNSNAENSQQFNEYKIKIKNCLY